MKKIIIAFHFLFLVQFAYSQSASTANIIKHITFLADDQLQGRLTGSHGEQLAADYISNFFAEIGLQPKGENNTYLQPFLMNAGKELGKKNFIQIPNNLFQFPDVYPMQFSANGNANSQLVNVQYGIVAPSLQYDDYLGKNVVGKIVLIKLSSPEGYHPHTAFYNFADERTKIKTAVDKGAVAIIFYNEDINYVDPISDYTMKTTAVEIPVLYANRKIASLLSAYTGELSLFTELNEINKTGHNVIGYIDNNAERTIVFGAHYDHLGYNELGGSLYRGEPAIHNGADDNASGVALILEMAAQLKNAPLKNNNYLFIAFSGEEEGLFGSNAFTKSIYFSNYAINYMFNYDMVGRLDSTGSLIVSGVGTSPSWQLIKKPNLFGLTIKTTESGIGPSDHTSFYLRDVPVLHFFTGSHNDYHKPSDDIEKINFDGVQTILNYTRSIIDSLNDDGRIIFTKTKDDSNEDAPRFTVTLGVVPDYAFEGKGMRIDGVSDGKPAAKIGLLSGDVVLKLGDYEVVDMMSYMKALSHFNKGDATIVVILRNDKEQLYTIQF